MSRARALSVLVLAASAAFISRGAFAAGTVVLPAATCPHSDPIFANGFETAPAIPSQPSLGSGGAYPGNVTRTVAVGGLGSHTYDLHVPAGYTPALRAQVEAAGVHTSGRGPSISSSQPRASACSPPPEATDVTVTATQVSPTFGSVSS